MNAERFAAIVEAYGADQRRWPAHERPAAQAFAAADEGRRLLQRATVLDDLLNAHDVEAPGQELRRRVLDARPAARRPMFDLAPWARAWGAGLAAAGLAGVVFGAALSGAASDSRTETLLAETDAYDVAGLTGAEGEQL